MSPFPILKWCFLLLGAILLSQILVTLAGSFSCFYFFLTKQAEIGACSGFLTQSREIWAEALAVVLALLLAARSEPPRDPPNEPPDAL